MRPLGEGGLPAGAAEQRAADSDRLLRQRPRAAGQRHVGAAAAPGRLRFGSGAAQPTARSLRVALPHRRLPRLHAPLPAQRNPPVHSEAPLH